MIKTEKQDGRVFYSGELELRQSGKSTALALKYLSEAVQNPNTYIIIKDHLNNLASDKYLLERIKEISTLLKLEDIQTGKLFNDNDINYYVKSNWIGYLVDSNGVGYKKVT